MTGANAASMLIVRPISRFFHRSPDVGSPFCRAGIAGKVVVFKGSFNPVLTHAIGISGDTERYISSGGCRAALKTENVGNGVGLQHLNRIRAQAPCT